MEREQINTFCQVIIAFSTFVGVGGATAVYLNQFAGVSPMIIVLLEIIYVLATLLILSWINGGMS